MGYAGDLTPEQTFDLLSRDPRAVLVDVRTRAEWAYVGTPDLAPIGREAVLVEWQTFPGGGTNPGFLEEPDRAGVERDAPVAFLCRSGVRSKAAAEAATKAGWTASYNILHGFEGPPDDAGHRGNRAGWKVSGLPWRQS